jgi:hypothetical protein
MKPTVVTAPTLLEPTFARLLAALGGGAVLVTGLVALTSGTFGLCLALSVLAMLCFAAIVLHEVGRLLDDEAGDR